MTIIPKLKLSMAVYRYLIDQDNSSVDDEGIQLIAYSANSLHFENLQLHLRNIISNFT